MLAYAGGVLVSRLSREDLLYAAVLLVTVAFTAGLLITWLQHPISPLQAFSEKSRPRSDNQWAAYLVVMATALLLYAPRLAMRFVAMALLVAGILATGVSYVLSSWFGVLAAITVLVWHRYRLRGLVMWLVALLVVATLAEAAVAAIVLQRVGSADVDRIKLWQSALTVWTRSPVIGVGPGNLASYMEAFNAFPLGIVLLGYQEPHNIFLEVLAENGAVGFLLFATFLALVTRSFARARGTSSVESFGIATGLGLLVVSTGISAFGGGFVPTIASAGYNALPTIVMVWVLIGCGAGIAQRATVRRPYRWEVLRRMEAIA
jgi:O-antigen ligase